MRPTRTRVALSCAALACAIALAATALGELRGYQGGFTKGGSVAFQAQVRDGDARFVKNFHWRALRATCKQGELLLRGRLTFPVTVNDHGAFKAVAIGGGDRAELRGEFTDGKRRAVGFLRVQGNFPTGEGLYRNCDTGRARWQVSR